MKYRETSGDTINRRAEHPFRGFGALVLACGLSLLVGLSLSCSDAATDPGVPSGTVAASLGFTFNSSTLIQFAGTAAWPPAGSGAIAGIDESGRTLQIMGYHQLPAQKSGFAGPEPGFNFMFMELSDSAGISTREYSDLHVILGVDIALDEVDSLAYFGSSGSLTLTTVSTERVEGTFQGTATRPSDLDVVTVSGGTIGAPLMSGLFASGDTGMTGGAIQISVGTGTTPIYSWAGGPVNAVAVSRAASPGTLIWGVLIAGGDSVASGVVHGLPPDGALLISNREAVLTAGIPYRISVSRTNGSFGYTEFIP